jgi:hypothetical protein
MVTATNVTFLTVAIYLLDLGIKIVALGLVPEGRRPSSATALAAADLVSSSHRPLGVLADRQPIR